jgi:hypothetical protein
MAREVFLSYRSEDKAAADRLCEGLESRGIECWIAPRNIPPGTEWPAAIVEAIGACRVFVMLLSAHSLNAKQISREAELADKQGCQIITFRLENVEPPPGLSYFLGNIQWLDAFGDQFDAAMAQLAQVISKAPQAVVTQQALPSAPPAPPTTVPATSKPLPWLGLAGVVAALVIGGGVWLGTRPPKPNPEPVPPTDEMSQAKAVADRFLTERETGQAEAAWADFADTVQSHQDKPKWLATQAALLKHGHITNKFNGCTVAGNGFYCDYTMAAADGATGQDKIWLIRDRDSNWKISRSEWRMAPKG